MTGDEGLLVSRPELYAGLGAVITALVSTVIALWHHTNKCNENCRNAMLEQRKEYDIKLDKQAASHAVEIQRMWDFMNIMNTKVCSKADCANREQ